MAQGLGDWLAPRGIRISFVGHADRGLATSYPPQVCVCSCTLVYKVGAEQAPQIKSV